MQNFQETPRGCIFSCKVSPRSRENSIGLLSDGLIRIKLKAPPVEGRANRELVNFLAGFLGAKKADIEVLSGLTSSLKRVRVANISLGDLEKKLKGKGGS